MSCYTEELIDEVINQIIEDVNYNDRTALYILLENLEARHLEAYLQEPVLDNLKRMWNLGVDKTPN